MKLDEIKELVDHAPATALYFSAPSCNVCHALKPKLFELLSSEFKQICVQEIDTSLSQEIAAHFSVFTIPTLLVFFDGKEFVREARHMSVEGVAQKIGRPYEMIFG